MKLEDLVGHKVVNIVFAHNRNIIDIDFDNNLSVEICAIPDDGTLYIQLKQYKLEKKIISKEKI